MEKVFLTGEPRVGKSTIISKLHDKYPDKTVGVIAGEIKNDQGIRQGFTSGTFDNPTLLTIAHIDSPSEIRVSRYGVDVEVLDQVANELANQLKAAQERHLVLLFDEVGLMQSYSAKLKRQLEELVDSNVPAIMAIKQDDSVSDWLKETKQKPNTHMVTVTEETRDQVLEELSRFIEANTSE